MPAAPTASARRRQSSTNLLGDQQGAREFAARPLAAAASEASSLKLDSSGDGRWAGQQRRKVSTADHRRLGLAAGAGLDLDIAAQAQLAEAGDRLLEGRHAGRQLGARRLGDQPIDARGALQRLVVHHDRHAVGGQLDVGFDPGGAAFRWPRGTTSSVFSGA